MKESALYISFFKKNFLLIIIPALLLPAVLLISKSEELKTFTESRLYEIKNPNGNSLFEADPLADQAVKVLRSGSLQKDLNLHSKVTVYKYAPAVISLGVSSKDQSEAKEDLQALGKYMSGKYQISQIGADVSKGEVVNSFYAVIFFFTAGAIGGLIVSLIFSYFKNF